MNVKLLLLRVLFSWWMILYAWLILLPVLSVIFELKSSYELVVNLTKILWCNE